MAYLPGSLTSKCELTGEEFGVSPGEISFSKEKNLPPPRRSESERLRSLLAFVPDLDWIRNQQWRSFYQTSSTIDSDYRPLPPFYFSSDNFTPILGTRENEKINLSNDNAQNERSFIEKFYSLYENYVRQLEKNDATPPFNPFNLFLCQNINHSAECIACSSLTECYDCLFCSDSINLYFSRDSHNCNNSYFLESCTNCSNCLFCSFLNGKSYHIFNEPVSKDEYQQALASLHLGSAVRLESARERFEMFLIQRPLPSQSSINSVSSTGNYFNNCKNSREILLSMGLINSEVSLFSSGKIENSFSLTCCNNHILECSLCALANGHLERCITTFSCIGNLSSVEYSIACEDSANLFGCVGLRGKEFCILNIQYNKSDFFNIRSHIISELQSTGHYGSFFPARFSPVPYNASLAGILFPLGKVQAQMFGYIWDDQREKSENLIKKYLKNNEDARFSQGETPPDSSKYLCEISGTEFEICAEERSICEHLGVALPARSPQQRFYERLKSLQLGRKRFSKCPITNEIFSTWYQGPRPLLSREGFAKVCGQR
ncbi:MAG TPA: hypothetical protein PKA63_01710 [Oligoflexia bacterium]|nr:hypothetical protein [Oligoflexia bacterium]HMP47366.1 hypothetical protein [Oligoflexia bacterium]